MTKVPTSEDEKLVIDNVEMIILLDIIELNIKKMKVAKFKLGEVYNLFFNSIQDQISKDASAIRKEMRRRGIKVLEEKRFDDRLEIDYLCRGYTGKITMLWPKVRCDFECRLAEYFNVDVTRIQRNE
ncbi:hypothetical protein [Paenibacillus medicaginis]|uniref:Uncharacterized protein n=1 Tax=Paenibacillus medicaginis TaxID=1470560 RepID=A0ABV5BUY9_9BACL